MRFILLLNAISYIWNNTVIRRLPGPHDFNSRKQIHYWSQWGPETSWIIFQSIFFNVKENKEMYRGLEQFEFKYMIVSSFMGEVSF